MSEKRRKVLRKSGGFTFTELLIVVSIIAIVGALSVSALVGTYLAYKSSTRSILEKMRGDVLRARIQAKAGVVDQSSRRVRMSDYSLPSSITFVTGDNPVAGTTSLGATSELVFEAQTGQLPQSGCVVLRDSSDNETYALYFPQTPTEIGFFKKVGEAWQLSRGL